MSHACNFVTSWQPVYLVCNVLWLLWWFLLTQLSHYLDLVEVQIAKQISLRSEAFFQAMSSHDQLQLHMSETCASIKHLRYVTSCNGCCFCRICSLLLCHAECVFVKCVLYCWFTPGIKYTSWIRRWWKAHWKLWNWRKPELIMLTYTTRYA